MQKYKLKLQNINETLLPYRQQIDTEFQNAVLNGDITSYNIVRFIKDIIEIEVYGEKAGRGGKQWHQKFGVNLKNVHDLGRLCCPPNSSVMFGKWIQI
ncbi:MAG: hypothetical protein F8N39_15925 [Clostridiaceae bacterium]|nr:hypothetical protein [Clostridiaceae bacterium]